jgi:VWFA-related protein
MRNALPAGLGGWVWLMAIAAATVAHAQMFRSGVAIVALAVTVTDSQGRSVSGLTAGDFAVYEDGVRQPVSLFGSGDVPLDVALVLDTSSSMRPLIAVVRSGARGLVSALRVGDRVSVVELKQRVRVRQSLTGDLDRIGAAIDALEPSGTTALYDALYMSLRQFERERRLQPELRRQALVLFSDGLDTTSHLDFDEIVALARAGNVVIYTITPDRLDPVRMGTAEQRRIALWEMRTLTRDTGGLAFFTRGAEELERAYSSIAQDLVNQYAVGYIVPRPGERGTFRQLSVQLVPPARGVARTRAGYTASPEESTGGRDR